MQAMTPAEKIRAARKRYPLSQEKLGARVGLTGHTIGQIERGVGVKPSTLKIVGNFLGIPWEELSEDSEVAS